MRDRSIGLATFAGVLLLALAPAASAQAALNSTESDDGAKRSSVNAAQVAQTEPSVRTRSAGARGSAKLRCWSYGKLVYEGTARGQITPAQPAVFSVPSDERAIQILDLKSGFCVLD